MESGALGMEATSSPGPGLKQNSMACLRRQAWAQSKESFWQESKPERPIGLQGPQQIQSNGDTQRPAEEQGQVPYKIASWLSECRTPVGASLESSDQSASPIRGAPRNGCSFEDDLSLGAEANYLQSNNNKTESCFDLAADQKRSKYKESGRSMNSTGSGKSSTVSSVSELLDLYEEDPEEILLNLGFGREEPDLSSKIPSRFFNSSSSARGIDIKVYLAAQLQRMELENPNYALTSRFRQIEVLTTVANEFFQLYSQVSGQPVQRISSKDQGGDVEGGGRGDDKQSPPLKKRNSALNVAKILKRTISKHNLIGATPETPEAANQPTLLNGHAASDDGHTSTEQDRSSTESDHQAEIATHRRIPKKDSCSLAVVTEETSGDGETGCLTDNSPAQDGTKPKHQPQSADLQSSLRTEEEGTQVVKETEKSTSTPEKVPLTLAPLQLAQLRTENADSFDMEEVQRSLGLLSRIWSNQWIQSNEDEALPHRTSRSGDLLRTVSQQSDSSGFAEEPSADSNSYLKVQESSDSCDSETTVTSHPSQDVATPLALDQQAFDLPDGREEEVGPGGTGESDGGNSSREEDAQSSERLPLYTAHHLPRNRPTGAQQDETLDEEKGERQERTDPDPEPENAQSMAAPDQEAQPELENSQKDLKQEPQHIQNPTETAADTDPSTERASAEGKTEAEPVFMDNSGSLYPLTPSSPVLNALNRARQNHLNRTSPQSSETPQTQRVGRGRRGVIPMQRSSSLPSSLLSPSRVVSSVRIQFGQGLASCTQPKYSFKYTAEAEGKKEEGEEEKVEEEEEEEEEEEKTNCLSTLIINPASSFVSNKNPPTAIPPKPIPRYLMRSSYSLQSSSPPPDWYPGAHAQSWSTQSVPDVSSSQQQSGQFQQSMIANQTQQNLNLGQMIFPNLHPSTHYPEPSPSPSPRFNSSPHPFTLNPLQYPSPLHPYGSLPDLFHHHSPSLNHHSSLTSLHQPTASPGPLHGSTCSLHQNSNPTIPHSVGQGHLHPGPPTMHLHSHNHPYSHQAPYHVTPQGPHFASSHLTYQGYLSPHLSFPHHIHPHPMNTEHSLYPNLAPPAPGFFPGLESTLSPGHSLHPGLTSTVAPGQGPCHGPSSTEMQLRRVLYEIRGAVQSLNRSDTPDTFSEHRTALPSHQTLAEFQQKRRSLNLFRSQMMDLELAIIRQQAPVYNHLSPADRLELEQLQSLRSAVREELQELEQQLEDRLMELTNHTQHRGIHRDYSIESLSATSALRAMEPVSDLLREQLFLQSELSSDHHSPSTNPSPRSSSPVRGGEDGKHRQGVYRASINITPVPPPRPNTHTEEMEEEERVSEGGGVGGGEAPEAEQGAVRGVGVDNLQQLIREIRENVAQEVRREIYSELMAAVSPRISPLPARQPPL